MRQPWTVRSGVTRTLTPERTVHGCLKAYRDGNFYGAAHGLGELKFTSIAFTPDLGVRATTDKPAKLEVITARGVQKTVEGTEVTWTCPKNASSQGPRVEMFARVRATALDGCGEVLYSQAGMLV